MWGFLKKLQIELPYDPLLDIYTEETRIERDMCTPMFITSLFTIYFLNIGDFISTSLSYILRNGSKKRNSYAGRCTILLIDCSSRVRMLIIDPITKANIEIACM